jgi:hypothetical protein
MKSLACLIAACAISLPVTSQGEVLQSDASGFVVHGEADVETSMAETWTMLVQPSLYWTNAHSWSGDVSNMNLSAKAGGCFCEVIPGNERRPDGSVEHMRVIMAAPYRQLTMRGSLGPLQAEALTGTLTVQLEDYYGGTRITWDYVVGGYARFDLTEIAPAVDGVIAEQMNSLADRLGRVRVE